MDLIKFFLLVYFCLLLKLCAIWFLTLEKIPFGQVILINNIWIY